MRNGCSLFAKWFVNQARVELRPVIEFLKLIYEELDSKDQKNLLNMIDAAEAYWIGDFDPHCPIYQKTRKRGPDDVAPIGGVVAVNGGHVAEYTIRCFAHRALTPDFKFNVVKCDDGCVSTDRIVESIQANLRKPGRSLTRDEARELSEEICTFCVLPEKFVSGIEDESLEELQQKFPSIVFVVWPGPTMEERFVPTVAARVNPYVDPALESRRRDSWNRLHLATWK